MDMKYLNNISSFFGKNTNSLSKNNIQDYFNLINKDYNLRKLSYDVKAKLRKDEIKESTLDKCIFRLKIYGSENNLLLEARIPFIEIPGPYILSFDKITKGKNMDLNKEISYPTLYTLYKNGKSISASKFTPGMKQSYLSTPVEYATLEIDVRCDIKEPIDIVEESCEFLIRKFGFKKQERTLDTRDSENSMEKKITYIKTIKL